MSGHSKWSSIKHKKGVADARRGKIFTKLINEITIAARTNGGKAEFNPRLRAAIAEAKTNNMPASNIERAIAKGTGELEGVAYEECTYEGYGPYGVAIMVDVITDNKNRSSSEIRKLFSKNNGSLGEVGCVGWMFDTKGLIILDKSAVSEERLIEIVLEAGADDIEDDDGQWVVSTEPAVFQIVKDALDNAGISYLSAKIDKVPQNTVHVSDKQAEQLIRLATSLEEHEDVQNVYANFEIATDDLPFE